TIGGKLISYRGSNKYSSRWSIKLAEAQEKDVIERLFRQNPLITFWPEPKNRPRDLFDVAWKMETLPYAYTDVFKPAGHTIEAEVAEI
ncbi:MAG TPA: hypothetical protein PLL10_11250, partial [Elusimicrobiales bacterium]|nr:hypothetical protein [Elusimicrobiales bacterium]